MSEFKIEKGINIPKIGGKNKGTSKYPFADMEVGDSFFVDDGSIPALNTTAKRLFPTGRKFTCRRIDGGVRVWRVA